MKKRGQKMGLFSKKKKKEELDLPPLNLPEIPRQFPTYTPAPKQLKLEELRLPPLPPIRPKPETQFPYLAIPQRKQIPFQRPPEPTPKPRELPQHYIPTPYKEQAREKPLFVEIQNYEDAINSIKEIKEQINNSEALLQELESLKQQEERELQKWRFTLNKIKNNLISINNKLSE